MVDDTKKNLSKANTIFKIAACAWAENATLKFSLSLSLGEKKSETRESFINSQRRNNSRVACYASSIIPATPASFLS